LSIKEELSFARNRLVESFMCAAGVAFEPKYKSIRKWLTKVIVFVLVIDDVYDIHASFEELKPFTMAFERSKKFQMYHACPGFTSFIHLSTIKSTGGTDSGCLELNAVSLNQ